MLSAVLDLASSLRLGVSHRQVMQAVREVSKLRGRGEQKITPVIIDDAEALPSETRRLAVELVNLYTGCRNTVVVYALLPSQARELPVRVAGDIEAYEFVKKAGIPHCGIVEGLAKRVIFVPPDVNLTSRVVSSLAPVDSVRVAEESHGLPGVAVALIAGGTLSLAGMPLSTGGLQDAVRGLVASIVERDPAVAILAAGGPLWGDTLSEISLVLSRLLIEKSKDPKILSTLQPRDRTLYRLLLLGMARKLVSNIVGKEYAPDPRVVDAYSSRDGRLLLSYRREIGDFLETAIRGLLSSSEDKPVELMVASLVASLPKAMMALAKSNPLADLFTARSSALALEYKLDSETSWKAYLSAVTSLLLNSPGLARYIPVVRIEDTMDEEAIILALKLVYQAAQARISNPSLPDLPKLMGIIELIRKAENTSGFIGALALMAEAGRARSENNARLHEILATRALERLKSASGCAEKIALLRALLDSAAALSELGISGSESLLEKAFHIIDNLPEDPKECPDPRNLKQLYYPAGDPEKLYSNDLLEMKAFIHYTIARLHYNKCSLEAAHHALEAARILASMYNSRPYYTVHNLILVQSLLIRALLVSGASCRETVTLLIPKGIIEEVKSTLVIATETLYTIAAEKFPNTLGDDALDALYYMYKIIATYCNTQPKQPLHNTGKMLEKLENSRLKGICSKHAPKCMPEKLADLGCL